MHRGDLPAVRRDLSVPVTPGRTLGSPGRAADPILGLSPMVVMASRVQRSGKTISLRAASSLDVMACFGRTK